MISSPARRASLSDAPSAGSTRAKCPPLLQHGDGLELRLLAHQREHPGELSTWLSSSVSGSVTVCSTTRRASLGHPDARDRLSKTSSTVCRRSRVVSDR